MFNIVKEYEKRVFKFPLIAQERDNQATVLFFDSKCGVIINSGTTARPVGYTTYDWVSVDRDCWKILHENVKIHLIVKEPA